MCAAGEARKANHHPVFRDPPRVTHASIRQKTDHGRPQEARPHQQGNPSESRPTQYYNRSRRSPSAQHLGLTVFLVYKRADTHHPQGELSSSRIESKPHFFAIHQILPKKPESRNHEIHHLHPRPPHRRRLGPGVPRRRGLLGRGLRSHICSSQDMVSRTLTR